MRDDDAGTGIGIGIPTITRPIIIIFITVAACLAFAYSAFNSAYHNSSNDDDIFALGGGSIQNPQRPIGIYLSNNERSSKHLLFQNRSSTLDIADPNDLFTEDGHYISALPRTDPSMTYNDVSLSVSGKRYLLFSPSGGWSNQLVCMQSALQIGKMLNRTVLIPMAARHTNGWGYYNHLEYDSLFPMDKLLDFEFLNKFTPVIPLNITVDEMRRHLAKDFPKNHLHTIRDDLKLDRLESDDVKLWNRIQAPFLFITGKGMYHRWFPTPVYVNVRKNIRYAKFIRDFALKTTLTVLGGVGEFNAVHIRRGDYMKTGYTSDADKWASKLSGLLHFKRNMTLYIATEPISSKAWFRPILSKYKSVFSRDLPDELVHTFKRLFPPKTRSDFLGLLEQLICVQAKRFAGSYYSTFSSTINFMRKKSSLVFPEIEPYIDSASDSDVGGDDDSDGDSDSKDGGGGDEGE